MILHNKGYASIVLVFIIGLVGVYLTLGLIGSGTLESFGGRGKALSSNAFYAAESGVEEAFRRLGYTENYGNGSERTFSINLPIGARANVSIIGDDTNRTIKSVGTFGRYVRRIETEIFLSEVRPGFDYAIHAGTGGFEIRNNSVIVGKDATDGNVYSNAFIKGAKNDYTQSTKLCKNSSSEIRGFAWAVTQITRLDSTDHGVCVAKNAAADTFDYCSVMGNTTGPNSPSPDCPVLGTISNSPAPTPIPLPDMGIDDIKSYLTNQGTEFTGDCVADGSGSVSDCTNGTGILGTTIISGSLTVPSNESLLISGPIWVQDTITLDSNVVVGLTPNITSVSQIIITDKLLTSNSNVTFNSNASAYLLFISTFDPRDDDPTITDLCMSPSISVYSNTNSVLFYSPKGCVQVNANSTFHGAVLGEKIRVENNSVVEYDPALSAAIFGITSGGGWETKSFKEY